MQYIFLFLSTFLAYFVKGLTGFGNTLVMGTLFTFVVPNRLTTPIDLLFSIPSNIFIVWRERKSISLKVVVPLSLMLLMGIIPGTFLLKTGNDWLLRSILGLVVVAMGIEMLTRKPVEGEPKKTHTAFLIIIGIISGVLAGMYGIGAPLVAYISRNTNNRSAFRANVCCVFLVDNVFRFFLYWFTGILSIEAVRLTALLLPAVVLGMFISVKVDARISESAVKKTIVAILIISGIILFARNALFFAG